LPYKKRYYYKKERLSLEVYKKFHFFFLESIIMVNDLGQSTDFKLFVDEPWFYTDVMPDSLVQHLLQSKHEDTLDLFVQLLEVCLAMILQGSILNDQIQLQAKHNELWDIVMEHIHEVEIEEFERECLEFLDDDNSVLSTEKEMDTDDDEDSLGSQF